MRVRIVAGGLVERPDGRLLLVQNRRRDGSAPSVCEPVGAWLAGTVEPLGRYHLDGDRLNLAMITRL